MKLLILVIFFIFACGKEANVSAHPTTSPIEDVAFQRSVYLWLTQTSLDSDTFVSLGTDHCDSLLFTSLYMASGGGGVDLDRAKNPDGLWVRHPKRNCGSTISKDMYQGLFTYLWRAKDRTRVEDLIKAGEEHNWVMGEGPAGDVVLTPNMIATLFEMRFRLGGSDGVMRHLYTDKVEIPGLKGFEAHLQVIHILLRGSLMGGLSDLQLSRLKEQAERQPRNALFQAAYHRYTDGNQDIAIARFKEQCPEGRRPTSAERCNDYLWQRDDQPKDWAACPKAPLPEVVYTGVDCEVAAAVIEGVLD